MKLPQSFRPKLFDVIKNGYTRKDFFNDLVAGLIVGAVALPLAIAFGIASGVTPEQGLITAIVAGFICSMLSGSRVQIGGPTGAFIVVIYGVVQKYGLPGLTITTIVAGVIVIAMGLAKFGSVIKFIPAPVITGFTSGIAVIIFSTQIKDLFGLKMGTVPTEFLEKWSSYVEHIVSANYYAMGIGAVTLLMIIYFHKITKSLPSPFVALIVMTVIVQLFHIPVETIGSKFGEISSALPTVALPTITFGALRELFPSIITIALLISIESLLSAVVADGMLGTKHRSNMELIAQGTANIFSGIFGGIPATGAIARTATNIKSGGRTPIAGIIHALFLLLVLVAIGSYTSMIPMPVLAAILVVVSYNMSEWRKFRSLFKAPKSDLVTLLTTFILTVLVDLTVAIEVGMVLAAFLFMRTMAKVTNINVITNELNENEELPEGQTHKTELPKGVVMFEINGPFFFGAAEKFTETIRSIGKLPNVLLLRMNSVPAIDATGIIVLEEIHKKLIADGGTLVIAEIHSQPYLACESSGLLRKIGEENVFGNLSDALIRIQILSEKTPSA